MNRRTLTLSLAGVLAAGLTFAAAVADVPYVALVPGPAYDTLGVVEGTSTPVISIAGRPSFPDDGKLDLTTVGVLQNLTLGSALHGWLSDERAVVPREQVIPPGRSDEQVRVENTEALRTSADIAVAAASRQLGLPTQVEVVEVTKGAPAEGKLKPGDVITSVDGKPVRDRTQLIEMVRARKPGDKVLLGYRRAAQPAEVELVTVGTTTEGVERAIVGVAASDRPASPLQIDIKLEDVGGPSAGLMFALGVIEKLGPESLTGGRHIAGTGTITAEGAVGPIGGIEQKLLGAKQRGATAFLVPADNCAAAAVDPPDGLQLVRVTSLSQSLDVLRDLREGRTPPGCT